MKTAGCLLGGGVAAAFGLIRRIAVYAAVGAARAVRCFGLYIPLAYLAYGGVLYLVFGFELFVGGTDGGLYVFGFVLSLICSVIITVRNLVVKPLGEYFRGGVIEYDGKAAGKHTPEAPKIYRSRMSPGIIVYEYANRYDLYEKRGGALTLVGREWKKDKR